MSGLRNVPTLRGMGWQLEARCAGTDPDIFFPEDSMLNENYLTRIRDQFCDECPVADDCLAFGLYERHGIWGGTNPRERARLRRIRRRLEKAVVI